MIPVALLCVLSASEPAYGLDLATPTATSASPTIAAPLADDLPGFSYTFVEANLRYWDVEDETLTGAEVKASLGLPLFFFLQGSYSRLSDDVDVDEYRLGLGAHFSLMDRLDLYGIVSYARAELDGGGFDDDEDGTAAELGVRLMLTTAFEGNAKAEWLNLDEDDANFGVGARYYITDRLSVGGEVESLDSDLAARAGLRFQF